MSGRFALVAALAAAAWTTSASLSNAPQAPAVDDAPVASEAPPIQGDLRDARKQLQELAEGALHADAGRFAIGVLAAPNFASFAESERAEFLFAVGVALGAAQSYEDAAEASHAARGLAGSSELGLDSAYNAGAFRLQRAELLRREIPEVRERLQLPQLPQHTPQATAPGGTPSGAQPPDALQAAREAYRLARADLVERWRADPSHRDTRANLELVQRRLRELDDLEREREQQQQDENEQQDPNQKNDSDPQQSPEGEQQEPQDDPQQQDPQQQPQEQKPEEQSEQQPEQDPSQDPQEQPQPQEQQGEQEPPQPDPSQPQEERLMTPEEIQRLLQQLEQIDEQAQQVQAALRRARRTPVKNDW